ncbi:amidohydrolase family protein [Paenibacillus sp. CC-CFT747]|nr:amidohydrolase family protein [Paenibacillus sp. CC-CFT747]
MGTPFTIRARHYRTNEAVEVTVQEGKIAYMQACDPQAEGSGPSDMEPLPFLAPGLVDLQINGYRGHDFNEFPMDPQRVMAATEALWKEGVTTYYPTVTTNADELIETAMSTIAEACEAYRECARCIAGIHLEGPFLSPEDGARGAHSLAFTKAPDWELFQRWQEAANGRIRLLTLSPNGRTPRRSSRAAPQAGSRCPSATRRRRPSKFARRCWPERRCRLILATAPI